MIINSPLFVVLPRKTKADKKVIINLNNYPHWHHFTYNEVKRAYCDIIGDQLKGLNLKFPIRLSYTLFKYSKRVSDRSNVLSVIDKFFCDCLVHYGCISDDNDDFIREQHFYTGCVDKENPRVEIEILEK